WLKPPACHRWTGRTREAEMVFGWPRARSPGLAREPGTIGKGATGFAEVHALRRRTAAANAGHCRGLESTLSPPGRRRKHNKDASPLLFCAVQHFAPLEQEPGGGDVFVAPLGPVPSVGVRKTGWGDDQGAGFGLDFPLLVEEFGFAPAGNFVEIDRPEEEAMQRLPRGIAGVDFGVPVGI